MVVSVQTRNVRKLGGHREDRFGAVHHRGTGVRLDPLVSDSDTAIRGRRILPLPGKLAMKALRTVVSVFVGVAAILFYIVLDAWLMPEQSENEKE